MCCGGFCRGLATIFVVLTNGLTFLLSCAVLALSIWLLVDTPSFASLLETEASEIHLYSTTCYLVMVLSILVAIVTFLGCCGVAKENRCMMISFLLLDGILGVGLGILTYFVFKGDLSFVRTAMTSSLKAYNPESNSAADRGLVELWDQMQTSMKCCGVDSWKDWPTYNTHFDLTSMLLRGLSRKGSPIVPESCCDVGMMQTDCSFKPTSSNGIYTEGCLTKTEDFIQSAASVIGGVMVACFAVMVINFITVLYRSTCGMDPLRRPARHSGPDRRRPRQGYGRAPNVEPA